MSNTAKLEAITEAIGTVLVGKRQQIRLALCCLLARGHLLIEDLPGMGKTTLANALSKCLGLSFSRIQFTSDLLPADIVGVSVFNRVENNFHFHPGPIFNQLVLADEINRTTPKTQSALLEAMAEGQVSVEGETRPLPEPFFVIATQNPIHQAGTFPLPESQLDRFLMRISLGYPDESSEKQILAGGDPRKKLQSLKKLITPQELMELQARVAEVKAAEPIIDYLQRLIQFTRTRDMFEYGLSPRAALAILDAAKAMGYLEGRGFVIPEDIQAVFPAIAGHRLVVRNETQASVEVLVNKVLKSVDTLSY